MKNIFDPSKLKVELRPTSQLKPYPRNTRFHSEEQIHKLRKSIKTFGFLIPALVDADNGVIAGHGRLEAAKQLGMETIPTICVDHLTEAQKRAYRIADNRLAELSEWDKETLKTEFQYLFDVATDFDITDTGFEMAEIDLLIQDEIPPPDPDDEFPDKDSSPVVSQLGDLWFCGPHKILCGNALEESSFKHLMGEERARMIITDPPYNVPIPGHVGGLGKVHHDDFVMASGEMTKLEYTEFLTTTLHHHCQFSMDGSLHYVFIDWRHFDEVLTAANQVYDEPKQLCVWNKEVGGMGSLYRSQHELIPIFKRGGAPHVNNIALGKHGRYRTNVWDYPGLSSFSKDRQETLEMHPTVKPVALVADAILDTSNRNDIVLDGFGGSGTTLIAAERVGRKARLIEIEAALCGCHPQTVAANQWGTRCPCRQWPQLCANDGISSGPSEPHRGQCPTPSGG